MVYQSDEENAQNSMGETSDYQYNNLDELLIGLVKERPALYDLRVPQKDRTKLAKQALWYEISKCMQGQLKPEAAETRWKYLRENFLKARKKLKQREDLAKQNGIPLQPYTKHRKYSFRYYHIMEFLCEALDYQKILSIKNATRGRIKTSPSTTHHSSHRVTTNTLVRIAPKINTVNTQPVPAVAVAGNFEEVDVSMQHESPSSPLSQQTSEYENSMNGIGNSSISNYDQIFLECLQKPIEKPSPIDGFLIRLGEGLKRLPYRERSKLELEFLTRLNEVEEQLEFYDENQ